MTQGVTIDTLRDCAAKFVKSESERLKTGGWWENPLLATAPVDERFEQLPRIAADNHIQPRDLLQTARSVIVFFIPFTKTLVKENRAGDRPCRNWGLSYIETNDLIGRLSRVLGELLEANGFNCGLTPATHNFDDIRLVSRWSHKHLAHLVGLGRFGIHHLMITPAGCAGRLGSLVTEADLGDHPLIETDEACLVKAGKECGKCIVACPAEALSETGLDRRRCWDRLNENKNVLDYFSDLPESTHVCGKCAALMPCSFKNPVAGIAGTE